MKTFQELKEYLGGFRLGSFPTMKPMASLGDKDLTNLPDNKV